MKNVIGEANIRAIVEWMDATYPIEEDTVKKYAVTIIIDDERQTVKVWDRDERKACSTAMAFTSLRANGRLVRYEVRQLQS